MHYAPLLADVAPSLVARRLDPPVQGGWSRFNPTVEADGEGWLGLVRSSNYRIEPPGT